MKKRRTISKILMVFAFSFTVLTISCNVNVESNNEENVLIPVSDEIVLGNKIENPFSLKSERYLNSDIKPNYYYFKIRTTSLEGIEQIKIFVVI